jgi:ATP-dependent Clp protease ATP-binding subunit ClpC
LFLVDHGYDDKFGARPLKRTIQRYVEDPLSERILMAEFTPGDEIVVDAVEDDEESLAFRVASPSSAT